MNKTEDRIPTFDGERRRRDRQRDQEQRNIWTRCATLLRSETEDRQDADQSAVLGYN